MGLTKKEKAEKASMVGSRCLDEEEGSRSFSQSDARASVQCRPVQGLHAIHTSAVPTTSGHCSRGPSPHESD